MAEPPFAYWEPKKPKKHPFTKMEAKLFDGFMERLSDGMGNAGCNDFELPNTPANKRFLKKVIRASFSKKDAKAEIEQLDEENGDTLITFDTMVFGYLRDKLRLEKP